METALLKLFNAVQVEAKHQTPIPQSTLERTVRNGYILHPEIEPKVQLLNAIERVVGISGEKANAAFHQSWTIVQDASIEQLVLQQLVHYLTTYGFEQLGIYQQDTVYIPNEILELPDIQDNIPLCVVKAMTAKEVLEAIVQLGSGVALAQETLDDIMVVVEGNQFDATFIEKIGNRELRALLYDHYQIVPSEPVAFLRYLVTQLTGESLLIKNDALIAEIKQSDGERLDELIGDAPHDLASIFFRFKPLLLAMKSISSNKTFFNRLRKQANKLHKPLAEDYLNSVTAQIKRGELELKSLERRIASSNIFRKIRLASALNFRLNSPEAIVYRVRNGLGWATEFEWLNEFEGVTRQALNIVLASIVDDVRENVDGKTIYIPSNVHYALPATEKQFTGHLPTGSYVSVPSDLIVGIHWTNTDKRVDIDLSVIGESGKYGWDARHRSDARDVLFSGDMTDAPAPNGASELFYIKHGHDEPKILMANYFNFRSGDQVQCRILAAQEQPSDFGSNYMVDVSNIVASALTTISRKQNILGLITRVNGENRVYFANVSVGNSITSSKGQQSTQARKYLVASLLNTLDLKAVLEAAGATVVEHRPDSGDFINLTPNLLDKTTIINLIKSSAS